MRMIDLEQLKYFRSRPQDGEQAQRFLPNCPPSAQSFNPIIRPDPQAVRNIPMRIISNPVLPPSIGEQLLNPQIIPQQSFNYQCPNHVPNCQCTNPALGLICPIDKLQ